MNKEKLIIDKVLSLHIEKWETKKVEDNRAQCYTITHNGLLIQLYNGNNNTKPYLNINNEVIYSSDLWIIINKLTFKEFGDKEKENKLNEIYNQINES